MTRIEGALYSYTLVTTIQCINDQTRFLMYAGFLIGIHIFYSDRSSYTGRFTHPIKMLHHILHYFRHRLHIATNGKHTVNTTTEKDKKPQFIKHKCIHIAAGMDRRVYKYNRFALATCTTTIITIRICRKGTLVYSCMETNKLCCVFIGKKIHV